MTSNQYLQGILDAQKLSDGEVSALQRTRDTIEEALGESFGSTPRIYYGGSYGKKTVIKASYDLDIVFYYPHDDKTSVKQIRSDVYDALSAKNWAVEHKDVALRLSGGGGAFHIDVVPARAVDATFKDATLYRSKQDTTLKTSLKTHIQSVKPRRDLIKLMKLWKAQHSVPIKTFVLEQATLAGAHGVSLSDLSQQMQAALSWLAEHITTARLVDPANTNNVVSDLVTAPDKLVVAQLAKAAADARYWNQVVS